MPRKAQSASPRLHQPHRSLVVTLLPPPLYLPWDISPGVGGPRWGAGLAWACCQTGPMTPSGGHGHPVPSAAVGRCSGAQKGPSWSFLSKTPHDHSQMCCELLLGCAPRPLNSCGKPDVGSYHLSFRIMLCLLFLPPELS